MYIISKRGFTLVEMMTVIMIIGVLATSLYILVGPYMMRSRDTKRITDILGYTNILDTYDKNFDTYPSNSGSWGGTALGYCLTEVYMRWVTWWDNALVDPPINSWKFSALVKDTSAPPRDPAGLTAVPSVCSMPGSYIYSRLLYGTNSGSQMALIAAKLELRPSGNYGTGTDLIDPANVSSILAAKKSTIPDNAPDQLFVVFKLH